MFILAKVNFKELKELILDWNNISNIKFLEKLKFDNIERLDLCHNKIDKAKNALIITNLKSKIKDLKI